MRSLKPRSRFAAVCPLDALETRRLLAATLVQDAQAQNGPSGTTEVIDLTQFIDDPAVNTQVRFATDLGDIDLELFDSQKPITVPNFLKYVREGRYDGTVVHRVTKIDPNTGGIAVVQGGGFLPFIPTQEKPEPDHIDTPHGNITNEASTAPVLSNLRGTIAMARQQEPDTASSEWFINTVDNTDLDPGPAVDDAGYAVFGQVINNTIGVAEAIQALETFQLSQTFSSTPLRNVTPGQQVLLESNYVTLTAMTLPTKLTFTAQTSNPAVATVSVEGNRLTLSYGPTVGVATITITGTDAQNNTISDTFVAVTGDPVAPTLPVTLGGPGGPTSVVFTDTDGTVSTVSLRGGAAAVVTLEGDGLAQTTAGRKVTVTGAPSAVSSIAITSATISTGITIAGKGGDGTINLRGLTSDGSLRSISAKPVTFTGTILLSGSTGKLDLGNVNNATIRIGGTSSAKPVAITLGAVVGTNLISVPPVKSLTAVSFTASGATTGTITATSIAKFTTAGDMIQNANITGAMRIVTVGGNLKGTIRADTFGNVTVKGGVSETNIVATRAYAAREKPLGRVTVGGAVTGSQIRSEGNITSVSAGSIERSLIISGLASGLAPTVPPQPTAFPNPSTIGTVTIKGTYVNSNILASNLGRVLLGTLTTANSGTPFGLGANKIASITGSANGSAPLAVRNLDTPEDLQAQIGSADLDDFVIALV